MNFVLNIDIKTNEMNVSNQILGLNVVRIFDLLFNVFSTANKVNQLGQSVTVE